VQEKLHNEALTEYEADCTNPDLEKRVDEAYKDYYNACQEIADKLVEITNKIDKPTALQMVFEKRAEITNILS